MAIYFTDLPQELHVQILSNLDPVSLIRCAMTSKSVYDTFKNSSLLVYTIQLHLDGFKDSGTSTIYPELIESLVRRRQAWLSPERKDPAIHHMLRDCGAYEFVGGAFANTNVTTDSFEVRWVPTSTGDTGRTLQRASIGISVRDLTMDPTQDLIILLDGNGMVSPSNHCVFHIHIRTISTNTIHPLAQKSPLQFTALPGYPHGTVIDTATLHIANKTLAVYYRSVMQMPRVLIWDWTTSELLLDGIDPSLSFIKYDFGLLDSTYFFVACSTDDGLIKLYTIGGLHATHLASLHLPATSSGTSVRKISCHAGPIEAHPLPHTSFMMQNDNDRLHSFTVLYSHSNVRRTDHLVRPLFLFVHQRVFAKYTQRALMGTNEGPLHVAWEEWGPRNTMFTRPRTNSEYAPNFIRHVHGQRCTFPSGIFGDEPHTSDPNAHCVDILDFSLAAVLSAKGALPMSLLNTEGKLAPSSMIRKTDVPFFLDDVETHLPYVITTLDLKRRHDAYMIHADGIVGVNMDHTRANFALRMYAI